MIDSGNCGSWIFQVAPLPGESLGHYLGRFRRTNCLSPSGLAALMSIDVRLVRGLEMPSVGQPLNGEQLGKLAALMGLSETQIREMLPKARAQLHLATRLCPACYAGTAIHQRKWQSAELEQCDRHQHLFLTACPACGTALRLPALWESGCCECCWLPFSQMRTHAPVE